MWRINLRPLPIGQLHQWEEVGYSGNSPPPLCNFPVAVANENLFVFSGSYGSLGGGGESLFRFNLKSHVWTQILDSNLIREKFAAPVRRYGHSMIAHDNALYIFGGKYLFYLGWAKNTTLSPLVLQLLASKFKPLIYKHNVFISF